jgi:hypothetical protein
MNKDLHVVFNGFLHLPNLDKLGFVELINEYFNSNEKETIRNHHDSVYADVFDPYDGNDKCVCCGR